MDVDGVSLIVRKMSGPSRSYSGETERRDFSPSGGTERDGGKAGRVSGLLSCPA